jgi:hypothetical protein
VRNSTRQFVLLIGTLLSFSNGGSLFAGMVCQPEFASADPRDIFPKDIVARDPVRAPAENKTSEVNSSAFANGTPKERDESTTALIESLQLLGKSFIGPLEKQSLPGAQPNALDMEDGSQPKPPQPSTPSEQGQTGAAGIILFFGLKDQHFALAAWGPVPIAEREEGLRFHNARPSSDSPVARLFRPPRKRL